MGSPFLHALNIATLGGWVIVVGFGAVAWWARPESEGRQAVDASEAVVVLEDPAFEIGAVDLPAGTGSAGEERPVVPASVPLPSPPELAAGGEDVPLPEVPELPPEPSPRKDPKATKRSTGSTARPTGNTSQRPREGGARRPGSARSGGSGVASGTSDGGGMSAGARLAAGRMPAPVYPREARRLGQQGTVLVEFMIGSDGRVVMARVGKSSGWSSLDSEALRTVRRWKFPPGGLLKTRRPITFRLR
jgi:TonB family protein